MQFKKRLCLFACAILITVYVTLYFFSLGSASRKSKTKRADVFAAQKLIPLSQNRSASIIKTNQYIFKDICDAHILPFTVDIQMLNLYKEHIMFDNPDGGVWKQGWDVQVDQSRWHSQNRLKVFVVPHSHNDPGWKKTFEQYYELQTRAIFNNMITKLSEKSSRKFIWAEVSYLSLWWAEASEEAKQLFKQFVSSGQIEIVSGGWVMPDEANSHYYSIIQQLTHGHQWLQKHLNYKPKRSWSIDPFGTSPTMPFLLRQFGLESLVIQRTHYSVKKYLAKNKQLEFRWRQFWDGSGKFDFLTHMMPFYNYDIPHTCGPDPAVCCQFDFRRSFTSGMICPWKKQPQLINERNVAHRAEMLLDQYRKKAQLYSTNVLLVPLGDDFRYDVEQEWDLQYKNYQKLFNYMNNNPTWYVQAQFGTLDDYFEALKLEKSTEQFPSLSGDFFTYADRDDHYWSGYFTSRPYYKRMDRELISYLRSAEILHALAWKSAPLKHTEWMLKESAKFIKYLREARGSLSLFQHHDGITGTAKDDVVHDYAQKLERGMAGTQHVMQQSLNFLLSKDKSGYEADSQTVYFDLKKSRKLPSGNKWYELLKVDEASPTKRIVVFNSLSSKRTEIVSVKIEDYRNVELYDCNDHVVPYQINPFCEINEHNGNCFLLYFKVDVQPLSVVTYFLKYSPDVDYKKRLALVSVLNANGLEVEMQMLHDFIKYERFVTDFFIENNKLAVIFRSDGLMKAITLKEHNVTVPVDLNFVKYSCKRAKEMCGAYLFLPAGEGREVSCGNPLVKIIKGDLVSSVIVYCDYVVHVVHVYNCPGSEAHSIEVQNLVDIKTEPNFEMAMRLSTKIKNEDTFYTDLNGMQIIKRRYLNKLPLQANYYPMPTSIYIEDENTRLTVVSAQPLGASSLNSGEVEIMQDRRLNQDDNLGLGQGVMDNRPVLHIFKLTVEKRLPQCHKSPNSHPGGYLSMIPYLALNSILYPLLVFLKRNVDTNTGSLSTSYEVDGLKQPTDVDIHIVSVDTIEETRSVGIVLHRTVLDTCFYQDYKNYSFNDGSVQVNSYIPVGENDVVLRSLPSFTQVDGRLNSSTIYPMCAMDLVSFYVMNVG